MYSQISFLIIEDIPTYAEINRHNKATAKENQGK